MKKQNQLEQIYRSRKPQEIPWVLEKPPQTLVELVAQDKLPAGRAVDLGCGTGQYAIWLAGRGFEVTGIDISPSAVQTARQNAARSRAACEFLVADVLAETDLSDLKERFDFVYSWSLLHHIYPQERPRYARNARQLLKPGGLHVCACFSEQDPQFGGRGKYRKTRIGTVLYFSSEDEIRRLFAPFFKIEELRTVKTEGKTAPHLTILALMSKPSSP